MCRCGLLVVLRRKISYVFSSLDTNGRCVICDFEGLIAMAALVLRARKACCCGSCCRIRCILAFEGNCFSCGPSVRACLRSWCTCGLNTRGSKRFCRSCCRSRHTCCTHGICLLARSVCAHVLSMACSIWCKRCGRCGAIRNRNERKPCGRSQGRLNQIETNHRLIHRCEWREYFEQACCLETSHRSSQCNDHAMPRETTANLRTHSSL